MMTEQNRKVLLVLQKHATKIGFINVVFFHEPNKQGYLLKVVFQLQKKSST